MTLFLHEIKRNRVSLIIWTLVITFMLAVCVFIYPEMEGQMNEMTDAFADMGSFTAAFGMDELNFGEFMGYFGIECGNVLGLGGALFASILGISALAKEEKDKTAEFLLTHPVSRINITFCKLMSVFAQIFILNLCVAVVTLLSVLAVGEEIDLKKMLLLFLAYFLLQIEIGGITFGISAFLRGGSLGVGLGIGLMMYFVNIISNLTDSLEFLKYITPFAYAEAGYIINNSAFEWKYMLVGGALLTVSLLLGFVKYNRKDIA
ncbi:MAG: ABC transporter permease subunit [Clostridia bacterium]|nr:ABC transporter permease subunit [Clostridia bacterium]